MKRRDLIKLSGLALAGAAIPFQRLAQTEATYHFIGIGSRGGGLLETFARYNGSCKYTWITDQHNNICEIEGLKRVVYEHPYSSEYFSAHRIKELPEEKLTLRHSELDFDRDDVHLMLCEPDCYLSYSLIPQLFDYFENQHLNYHAILGRPFHFFDELSLKTADQTLTSVGDYPGKLTILNADSIVHRKKNMNLRVAIDFTRQRYYEEFAAIKGRLQAVG